MSLYLYLLLNVALPTVCLSDIRITVTVTSRCIFVVAAHGDLNIVKNINVLE